MRPGIEPTVSWFLVEFVSAAPRRELLFFFFIFFLWVLPTSTWTFLVATIWGLVPDLPFAKKKSDYEEKPIKFSLGSLWSAAAEEINLF